MARDVNKTRELLARLAGEEDAFLRSEFLAPALRGGAGVGVRIAGVRCTLVVEPADFEGWGVFRPDSHTLARLVRPARMGERLRYLELFPIVRLVLCHVDEKDAGLWFAAPASRGDQRFRIEGLVPVRLVEDAERFDTACARFDGQHFWFEQLDPRADAGAASYLRDAFSQRANPDTLNRPGLAAEQRDAFVIEFVLRAEREAADARRREAAAKLTAEGRLRDALQHAGAHLRGFTERDGVYTVSYTVDGARHTSVVDKRTLGVHTAGICLSGEDGKFDLHSLVGVLREARERW